MLPVFSLLVSVAAMATAGAAESPKTLPSPAKGKAKTAAIQAPENSLQIFPLLEKPAFSSPLIKLPNLHLARNEKTGFFIRVRAQQTMEPLRDISFVPDETSKETGQLSPEVKAYFVAGHTVKKGSVRTKGAGFVEDILVPNNFLFLKKFHLPVENIPSRPTFLLELRAPKTGQGPFKGEIRFTLGAEKHRIPVSGVVHPVDVPPTFSLRTSFGFNPNAVIQRHLGGWTGDTLDIYGLYMEAALEQHIDLHKIYLQFPSNLPAAKDQSMLQRGAPGQSFVELWDKWGAVTRASPMRFTDLPVPIEMKTPSTKGDKAAFKRFWTELDESVVKTGLVDKSFVYFADEPQPKEIPGMKEDLKLIRSWAPHLKFLAASPFFDELSGLIDVWVVNLWQWGRPEFREPQFYQRRQTEKKDQFWFYVSCNAHGCEGAQDSRGPDLVADRPSIYALIFPWMARRYSAQGILYYDTVYGYPQGEKSPWRDPFSFTGVGEGNLFYPCTQKTCGLDAALVSYRMWLLDKGMQDAEILRLAEDKAPALKQQLQDLLPTARSFPEEAAFLERFRAKALATAFGQGSKIIKEIPLDSPPPSRENHP